MSDHGRVDAKGLRLRRVPDGEVIRMLDDGEKVLIESESDGWMKVQVGGETGFVGAAYIKRNAGAAASSGERESLPGGFSIAGKDLFAPSGERFGRAFKKGIYNYGETSIGDYVASHAAEFGLGGSSLRVMQAVSENEGKLEAINTWDNAFLTFGTFQWTVGTGDAAGELPALVERFKRSAPDRFQDLFGQYGLDVTDVRWPANSPARGRFLLDGRTISTRQDKEALRAPQWAYRFWRAGADDTFRKVQIEHAASRVDLFFRTESRAIRGRNVADYVNSEYGVALLLDQHVNRPGHVPKVLAQAVDQYVEQLGADEPEAWGDAEEVALIEEFYLPLRHATSMTDSQKRAETTLAAVHAGLASQARGSYAG